ncbi:GPI-anchored adhesin-like protein, putative (DUF3741) [Wolffia australiana]
MNDAQSWQPREKPIPGCMGRMINILAPSPGTKMLSNKPHQTTSTSLPISGLKNTADSISSPAHCDPRRSSPGVVARLMGLDALPASQSQPACRDSARRGQQEDRCLRKTASSPPPPPPEKRMDLVRQKFMEAKRLATDQRLLQSKEFQGALEILSSNRDLFLKLLEEPNSLLSQAAAPPPPPPPPAMKRITVLKPSKSVENLPPPTRIVVLKPSPRKGQEPEPPPEEEVSSCRDVAKEITRQIRESLGGNRRDDALLSSVLSNGYTGDESSFNSDNLSDSELISWEHGNRMGSPFSLSSLSRGSYSPDSLVVREAKKRLSERWAMVASGGSGGGKEQQQQHQRPVRRSSSTLGEMLSIPEKKEEGNDVDLCLIRDEPPPELLRSKSLPSSSSSKRNLFKGKVSSLFFSRSKKQTKEKADGGTSSPMVERMAEAAGEQPSPVSVLAAMPDDATNSSSSRSSDGGAIVEPRREMISRSPPIGSMRRSLSRPAPKLQDQYSFVKLLLDAAGLSCDAAVRRWHSLESPLDPSLLDRFLEKDEDAKCRERRSGQRLLFDAANSALLEMAHTGCSGGVPAEEVWQRVTGWWSAATDPPGTGVERVMRMEVAEFAWSKMMELEREEIGGGIAAALAEEMVGEVLFEFIQRHPFH